MMDMWWADKTENHLVPDDDPVPGTAAPAPIVQQTAAAVATDAMESRIASLTVMLDDLVGQIAIQEQLMKQQDAKITLLDKKLDACGRMLKHLCDNVETVA